MSKKIEIEIVNLSIIIERKISLTFLSRFEKTEKRIREAEDKSIDIIQLWEKKHNRIGWGREEKSESRGKERKII